MNLGFTLDLHWLTISGKCKKISVGPSMIFGIVGPILDTTMKQMQPLVPDHSLGTISSSMTVYQCCVAILKQY